MLILLFGATDMGYAIAARLHQDHDLVLIDESVNVPERFANLDIGFVSGNGADVEVLERANAKKANLFIGCSTSDEANIVACWTAKKMTAAETVCFVSRSEIYHNLESSVLQQYHTRYDIDTVIWPEQLLTQDIFRIILVPEAIDVEAFDNGRVKLFEYRIREGTELCGQRIMDYPFPNDMLIVGITRDGRLFIPDGRITIEPEDKVIFMGSGPALDMLAAQAFDQTGRIRTATVIGGGNVGFFLSQQLERAGIKVKIIEQSERRCNFLTDNLKRSLVLNGNATDIELLEEENIGTSDVVVCVTDNDEKNLLCSLLVKELGVRRIVTRVGNARNVELFERVGIDVVVSPRESAIKELLNRLQARDVNILALVEGAGGRCCVWRFRMPFPKPG